MISPKWVLTTFPVAERTSVEGTDVMPSAVETRPSKSMITGIVSPISSMNVLTELGTSPRLTAMTSTSGCVVVNFCSCGSSTLHGTQVVDHRLMTVVFPLNTADESMLTPSML